MNKIIKRSLLLFLACPLLVGCGGNNNKQDGGNDLADAAQAAVNTVGVTYGAFSQSTGISLAGAKLITEYTMDDMVFDFAYTVAPKQGTYSHTYLQIEGDKLVVEIPTFAELNPTGGKSITYAAYVLSAAVTYKGAAEGKEEKHASEKSKQVTTKTWNVRINAEEVKPVLQKIADARKKANGETVVTTGYVCGFMNNVDSGEYYNGVWIADGNDGMMLYSGCLDSVFHVINIGDMVLVIGTASPYNGLFEVKPTTVEIVETAPLTIAQPSFREIDETTFIAMTDANCSDPVTFKNVTITADVDKLSSSGAMSIAFTIGSTSVTAYVNKHTNSAQRAALVDKLKANKGKPCTIKCVMGYNSGKLQLTPCQITTNGSIADCFTF